MCFLISVPLCFLIFPQKAKKPYKKNPARFLITSCIENTKDTFLCISPLFPLSSLPLSHFLFFSYSRIFFVPGISPIHSQTFHLQVYTILALSPFLSNEPLHCSSSCCSHVFPLLLPSPLSSISSSSSPVFFPFFAYQ